MLFACDLTVSGAILSCRAILLFDNPSPMRRTIVRSRSEREPPACFISPSPFAGKLSIFSENTVKLCSVEVSIKVAHMVIAGQPILHEQFKRDLAARAIRSLRYDLSTNFCHQTQMRSRAEDALSKGVGWRHRK